MTIEIERLLKMDVDIQSLDTQYDHLLNEVESTEGQLGAILRCLASYTP